VRRKDVAVNNEWTNYSDTVEADWSDSTLFLTKPLLVTASLQVNGLVMIDSDEQYFRQHIARKHRGGFAAYSQYIYGISFAERPGDHQPTGSINASGTITATDLNTSSDKRIKKNIKPIKNALDMLDQINGVSFDWKKDSKKSYGVIAQELQKVFPELVGGTEDSLAVSYIPLIAILIEAVKDQQKQIDKLKR
jgi:hypothetical protein